MSKKKTKTKTSPERHAHTLLTGTYTANTFRFCVHPEQIFDFPRQRPLEKGRQPEKIPVHKEAQGMLEARKKSLKFVFNPPTGHFKLMNQQKEVLSGSLQTGKFNTASLMFNLQAKDVVLGFGAATGRRFRNNQSFQLMNVDTLFYTVKGGSYSSFPFFIIKRGQDYAGIFLNSTLPARVVLDSEEKNPGGPGVHFDFLVKYPIAIDVFVFQGSLPEILQEYTTLTGRPFLPPVWSLGFHQSRWSYRNDQRVIELAERFRKEDIPCDAIHLDIHYMNRYRIFTWHPTRFKNPAELHVTLANLHMRTVAINDPGVAQALDYPLFQEGKKFDYFCKDSKGEIYTGKVWPGKVAYPDFTLEKVRNWWAEHHQPLFKAGVSGIWNDMNEPVLKMGKNESPLKAQMFHRTEPHLHVRNIYANLEAESTQAAFERFQPGKRPFILTRGAFCGIQKYAALWTGDNRSTWEHLRENLYMVLNLGLSGVPFSGADVGGFAGKSKIFGIIKLLRNKELFSRWMELGSLMPFFRAHTVLLSRDQEPWNFGEEALINCRKHIKRRYRLLPYIYSLIFESYRSGAPPVRPLFYDFPEVDPDSYDEQFMLGPALLSAPVLHPGLKSRSVYLPSGDWYDFETGRKYPGDRVHTINLTPGYYPLFIRAGTVLPLCEVQPTASQSLESELILEVYPGPEISGSLILDDGYSQAAQKEDIFELDIQGNKEGQGNILLNLEILTKKFVPVQKSIRIRVPVEYGSMSRPGKRISPQKDNLAQEDRQFSMNSFSVPMNAGQLEFHAKSTEKG